MIYYDTKGFRQRIINGIPPRSTESVFDKPILYRPVLLLKQILQRQNPTASLSTNRVCTDIHQHGLYVSTCSKEWVKVLVFKDFGNGSDRNLYLVF